MYVCLCQCLEAGRSLIVTGGLSVGLMGLWCEREVGLDLRCTGGKQSKALGTLVMALMGDGQWRGDAFGEVRLDE